jgi:hypothetical protein
MGLQQGTLTEGAGRLQRNPHSTGPQTLLDKAMDKLQLTGRNLGRVFNSRSCRANALQLHFSETEQPNLKLETRPRHL